MHTLFKKEFFPWLWMYKVGAKEQEWVGPGGKVKSGSLSVTIVPKGEHSPLQFMVNPQAGVSSGLLATTYNLLWKKMV